MQKEFMTTTELHGAEINEMWRFPENPNDSVEYRIKGDSVTYSNTLAESEVPLEEVPQRAASLYVDELESELNDLEALYHILEDSQ